MNKTSEDLLFAEPIELRTFADVGAVGISNKLINLEGGLEPAAEDVDDGSLGTDPSEVIKLLGAEIRERLGTRSIPEFSSEGSERRASARDIREMDDSFSQASLYILRKRAVSSWLSEWSNRKALINHASDILIPGDGWLDEAI